MPDSEERLDEAGAVACLNAALEGRSEALEHLMEHLILRKQEQVDFLERATG